jgi:hypothetical protein
VEGVGAKVEAKVRCLLLAACLCGGGGCDTLSISSSKCVSTGSGTSSSNSPFLQHIDILLQPLRCLLHDRLLASTLHGLVVSITSNEMASVSGALSILLHPQPEIVVDIDHVIKAWTSNLYEGHIVIRG